MTSECKRPSWIARSGAVNVWMGMLLVLGVSATPIVMAQGQEAPDADFRSPASRFNNSDASGDSNDERMEMRRRIRQELARRRRMQMQGEQSQGSPEGGAPGLVGPRLNGPQGPDSAGPGGGPGFDGAPPFRGRGEMRGMRGGMHGGMNMGMPGHRPLDLTPLNLTDDQKQRIQNIRKATREQAHQTKRNVMERQMQLRNLLFSADASDNKIRAARRELRDAQDKLDELNLNDMLQIRSILTAEQKQKLPDLAPAQPRGGRGGRGGRATAFGPG